MNNSQLSQSNGHNAANNAVNKDAAREVKYDSAHATYPCLKDSPLWATDYMPPKQPKKEETPPLIVVEGHYPRIAKVIEMLWGTREMDEYFRQLVIDDRRNRAGFPPEVLAAILRMSADHAKRFKFHAQEFSNDPWGADPFYRHAFRG